MHSAPAVAYPLASSRGPRLFWRLVALLVVAVALGGWFWQARLSAEHQLGAVLFTALTLLALVWGGLRSPPVGRLRWDGQQWWLQLRHQDELAVTLTPLLDFQLRVFVRCRYQLGGNGYCWIEYFSRPEIWGDFRRALFARPRKASSFAGQRNVP